MCIFNTTNYYKLTTELDNINDEIKSVNNSYQDAIMVGMPIETLYNYTNELNILYSRKNKIQGELQKIKKNN